MGKAEKKGDKPKKGTKLEKLQGVDLAKEWQVEWKDVNELTPYAKNARINDNTVPYLVNSIRRFGFKQPIVIDGKGVIICGHTRLKAALEIGMAKVPCVLADDLTEAEIKAFRLADNKIAEMSSWDYELLDEEMKELEDDFGDMADFGFASFEGDADLGDGNQDGDLPPELAGRDLSPDKLDDAEGEAEACARVIITFNENDRGAVAEILGVKELDKGEVIIPFEKLLEKRAENCHADSAPAGEAEAEAVEA